jgi:hypothetical protein
MGRPPTTREKRQRRVAGKGLARRDEIYPLIGSLIRAEHTHRQARSISYRIGGAKFASLFACGERPRGSSRFIGREVDEFYAHRI